MKESTSYAERKEPPKPYPAEKARGGEIILKTRLSRVIFFTGLFGGFVLMAIVAIYLAATGS